MCNENLLELWSHVTLAVCWERTVPRPIPKKPQINRHRPVIFTRSENLKSKHTKQVTCFYKYLDLLFGITWSKYISFIYPFTKLNRSIPVTGLLFFLNTEICHVHHHLINKAKVEVSRMENNSGFYLNVTFQDKLFFKTNKLLSLTRPIKCDCIVRSPTLQIVIISLTVWHQWFNLAVHVLHP